MRRDAVLAQGPRSDHELDPEALMHRSDPRSLRDVHNCGGCRRWEALMDPIVLHREMKLRAPNPGWVWLERTWQDIRYGVRLLAATRGFTSIAVLSLAIGIGANCAIFSFADALLLRPLPVARPGEVFTVGSNSPFEAFGISSLVSSYPDYVDIRDRARSLDGLVAFRYVT